MTLYLSIFFFAPFYELFPTVLILMAWPKIAPVSVSKGPPDAGPRVILSVDLWHPNVAAAERQALDFMFSPDL